MLNIVWFKRDLRVHDHAPLYQASQLGDVLPLYVYEPELIQAPDYALQHLLFANECLIELQASLSHLGSPLVVCAGEITQVLESIKQYYGKFNLFSHQETGNLRSYGRDRRVLSWCQVAGIVWYESPNNGVVRALKSRNLWSGIADQRFAQDVVPKPLRLTPPSKHMPSLDILSAKDLAFYGHGFTDQLIDDLGPDKLLRQQGGRKNAILRLQQFMDHDLADYRYAMSSPLSAEHACSRLSPYLSFGVLSIREVLQSADRFYQKTLELPSEHRPRGILPSLKSFISRLRWHCHFIQKLESEPEIEQRNMHSGFDGLRNDFNLELHERWCAGMTGYPLIDACMRMLEQTGWINFRMRAMLISFSSNQLWHDWHKPALFLARQFLDYEPGIHYPQVQMQSGVTGINTIRIYNPVKQARDQDPHGIFIKRWLPELSELPLEYLFQPWLMPQSLQQSTGVILNKKYPSVLVDHVLTARRAREMLWAVKQSEQVRQVARQVYEKHGSRLSRENRGIENSAESKAKNQRRHISIKKYQNTSSTTDIQQQLSLDFDS